MDFFNNQNDQLQKSEQLFRSMKPHLEAELRDRLVNGIEIKVGRPIRTFTETISKSESPNPNWKTTQQVIPANATLLYKGCELDQMFFEDTRTGEEYSVHSGENVILGEMQVVKNSGYIGLLTQTDIFEEVKNRILGR